MKTSDQISYSTRPSNHNSRQHHHQQHQTHTHQNINVIKIATNLVDSVANLLCEQIVKGNIQIDEFQIPLKLKKQQNIENSIRISPKTIDPSQHHQLILKFKKHNRKLKKQRDMRSLQLHQRSIKLKQEQQKLKQQSRHLSLMQRRRQIQKRMQNKKNMMKLIQKNILQSNSRIVEIKRKKLLYQQKEEQFYKKYTLPKLQQQKLIIEKKRRLRVPINLSQIIYHEKSYEKFKSQRQISRTEAIRTMITLQKEYQPPQFVPQSYKKVELQESIKKQQQVLRRKQLQIFQLRKKKYIRDIDQIRQRQREAALQRSRQKAQKLKNNQSHQKIRITMNKQQIKNAGNQYLKQFKMQNKNLSTVRKLKPIYIQQVKTERKLKSQMQIQSERKQRIQKVQKIQSKKISQIWKSDKLDPVTKFQKLKYQIDKLDEQVDFRIKQDKSLEGVNNTAGIMINSVHAKLALLQLSQKKLH